MKSMPAMVMQRFHNLRGDGGAEVPHRFYEVTGTPRERVVKLTDHLRRSLRPAAPNKLSN